MMKTGWMFVTEMSLLIFINDENWFDKVVSWSRMVITWSSASLFVVPLLLLVSVENLSDETMSQSEILITWSSASLYVILFSLKSLFLLFCVRLVMFWKSFCFSISAWIIKFLFLFSWRRCWICPKSTLIYWEFCLRILVVLTFRK